MAEIEHLPPAYRIPPTLPGSRSGQGSEAPQRKPGSGQGKQEKRRQRKKDNDDGLHIDEYV